MGRKKQSFRFDTVTGKVRSFIHTLVYLAILIWVGFMIYLFVEARLRTGHECVHEYNKVVIYVSGHQYMFGDPEFTEICK